MLLSPFRPLSLLLLCGCLLLVACDRTGPPPEVGIRPTAANCQGHLAFGAPSRTDQVLCRGGYALGYDYSYRIARWASYRLTRASISGDAARRDRFRADPDLPKEHRAQVSDYRNSGYDRGHLAPSEAIDTSAEINLETFYLSNMAPQRPAFNRGIWRVLESWVRGWTETRGELYVVTGTIFAERPRRIGENRIAVPSYFYKVIYDPRAQEVLAYLLPHRPDLRSDSLPRYQVTVDEIEARAGVDLLATLDQALEQAIEARLIAPWAVDS